MFPRPQLDANSEVPLYRQLYAQFRDWIQSGRLARGDRLPSTRDMAGLLGLNRSTVSAAYALLESSGLIQGQVGKGSFVTGESRPASSGLDWDQLLDSPERLSLALAQPPGTAISFATSRPAEKLFPIGEVDATCREVLASVKAAAILQLGSPGGYPPLREYLLAAALREGLARSQDDILITNGCQQGLDLVQRVLVRTGDTVLVEDPIYPGVKNLLSRAGARVVGIPVGPQGIDLDLLRRALERERPKVLVVTPNFQNPTGATIPLGSRRLILAEASEAGVVVVENDAYGELRYEGEPVPSLKHLDEPGDAILLRSFSKIAFPGLRVGWVIGPRSFISKLAEVKQLADLHTDQLSQAVLLRFAESGRLAAHKRRMIAAGSERLKAVLDACERSLPAGARFTRPEGGMNLWVRLPEPLDAAELLNKAEQAGVTYAPGRYFEVTHHEPGSLRLSFAGLAPDEIREGVATLGEIFSHELERVRATRRWEPAQAMV
jgi:2-aminoadipate transaminase